jgi:assimilatory nitrate reductase electron transfer subunit
MRLVVIGYGMAGARLVSEVHGRDPGIGITVLGAEPHRAYNRILLSNLIAGRSAEADVHLVEPAGRGVALRLGTAAAGIDRSARVVTTVEGDLVPYDRLVLATGSQAALPPIKGLVCDDGSLPDRVAAFRTLERLAAGSSRWPAAPPARSCSAAGCSGWRRPAAWPGAAWR